MNPPKSTPPQYTEPDGLGSAIHAAGALVASLSATIPLSGPVEAIALDKMAEQAQSILAELERLQLALVVQQS